MSICKIQEAKEMWSLCVWSFSWSRQFTPPPSLHQCGHPYLSALGKSPIHTLNSLPSGCQCDTSKFTFPRFLTCLFCPYRCFCIIPPSSSLKRCSPPEALPLLSTAALNAPTPVILAPDSRSFVDDRSRRSLAVGALSVCLCPG